MTFYSKYPTRIQKSGLLAEKFCAKHFGIKEDADYEIKSSCWANSRALIRNCQVLNDLSKQYVICRYRRAKKTISRGPHKGKHVYAETISVAYKKKIDVFVLTGADLLNIISSKKLVLRITGIEKSGKWAFYWDVPIRFFVQHLLKETEHYTLYGNPLEPPRWLYDQDCIIEKEDEEEECPF